MEQRYDQSRYSFPHAPFLAHWLEFGDSYPYSSSFDCEDWLRVRLDATKTQIKNYLQLK